jgi:de-etiolated-1
MIMSSENSRAAGESLTTNLPVLMNENTAPFYFVLYDMVTARVLTVLRNTSSHLLNVYENFQDYFSMSILDGMSGSTVTTPAPTSSFNFHTLPSNNTHASQTLKRHVKNILRLSSVNDMTKCVLAHLPISSQAYATAPYLDHGLFSYDEKVISALERPKPVGDQVIKFNMRESGRLSFRLYTGVQVAAPSGLVYPNKRLVAFIWHPREPFCMSVQRGTSDYIINFHVYSKPNLV